MPSRETFAYRRALKLRAQKAVDDTDSTVDSVFARAQDDFLTFVQSWIRLQRTTCWSGISI